MLGLLVIIIVSGLLLHFLEKKNIKVLGIVPNQRHLVQFSVGFLIIIAINLSMIYIETIVKSIRWEKNTVDLGLMLKAFVYHLKSALTEDLVFRGAILYILINRIGAKWALLISAFFFGIYHVFSYGMAGERIVPIVYVVLVTGFTGYVWAYVFNKTNSIYLGLGLHVGYNLLMASFYLSQPYGQLLFAEISKASLSEWNQFYYSLFRGFYPPLLTLIIVRLLFKSKFKFFAQHPED